MGGEVNTYTFCDFGARLDFAFYMVEGGFPILIMDIQKALCVDMYCHFQSPSLVRFASQQKRTKENEPQKLGQVNHLHPNFNPCCTKNPMLKIPQRVSTKGPAPSPKEFHQNRRLTNLKTGAESIRPPSSSREDTDDHVERLSGWSTAASSGGSKVYGGKCEGVRLGML